jgi:hypothetical protein
MPPTEAIAGRPGGSLSVFQRRQLELLGMQVPFDYVLHEAAQPVGLDDLEQRLASGLDLSLGRAGPGMSDASCARRVRARPRPATSVFSPSNAEQQTQ